uniref:Uncharacterized protein n=1 Tax=Gopherus agassizii TaxID=38772 RepID=A0A452IVL7_9SAUR
MERFIYPLYSVYQGYGGTLTSSQGGGLVGPKQKQPKWKQSKGSSPSLGIPTTPATAAGPEPADYLDGYMWAQLKALLSQVSPGLTPRLRKANTKEVGVQVNPGMDASVQCSMGTCTLQGTCPQSSSARFIWAGPAIYSPGLDWRLFTLAVVARPQVVPPMAPERKEGADGGQVALQPRKSPARGARESQRKSQCVITKLSLLQWESAYVWCISGSNKVYFKQLLEAIYNIEVATCTSSDAVATSILNRSTCPPLSANNGMSSLLRLTQRLVAPAPRRHIDLKRLHRQELCGHCKGKRLFCDNTYSFKYIV